MRALTCGARRVLAAVVAAGLLLAGTLVASSCVSTAARDLVDGGADALDRTRSAATLAEQETAEDLGAGIERFLDLFADFDPISVGSAARATYAEDAYFNDGFAEIEGSEAIAAYLARTAGSTAEIEVEIEHRVVADGEVYLRWVMRFTTEGRRGRTIVAPGMTHLRFDPEGRIVYHRDHWDAGRALAELVPLVGPILRAVRGRIEAD